MFSANALGVPMKKQIWASLTALALLAGCAQVGVDKPAADDTKRDVEALGTGKAEAWSTQDSPTGFGATLEYKLDALPLTGEATNIPWASSYWPTAEDSINHRWEGVNTDSPAKKFEKAFGLTGVEDAISASHGVDKYKSRKECAQSSECNDKIGETCAKRYGQEKGRCIPSWWGICHAWAPAAIMVPEPKFPVTHNGVTLKVNDIKALATLVHEGLRTRFVSLRCDKDNHDSVRGIEYDGYGRPSSRDAECRDTNPGTWHLLTTNYLGVQKASFVYDRTFDDEVWNQPLRGYRINKQAEVSAIEANRLIGVTLVGGTTVKKTGTVAKNVWAHQGAFAVVAGQTVQVKMRGTGDADLYVKFGAQPTESGHDCRPYASNSDEACELTVPAGATQVFVSINGYADTSTFDLDVITGGQTPTAYQFNSKATKFFHVQMEVDYITEASSATDGNLASRIDEFTRRDPLEYVLELDAEGKIIGGEWVGASKQKHPDFLWLPVSPWTTGTWAGGKITYARVKELIDRSLTPPGQDTTGAEKVVRESGTVSKSAWKHYGPFNVASGKNLTATLTGTVGDADLYVRRGAAPTTRTYNCRPFKKDSNEACTVVGPGPFYVSVRGHYNTPTPAAYSLEVKYTEGTGGTTPVDPPATFTHLNVTGTVAQGESKVFTMAVPAGRKVVVRTVAPNDVDLYVQMNAAPTTDAYLQRAWTTSGSETLTVNVASNGTLHVMVHGYVASTFTLTTADN